jgi:predicted NUDIX family NTP pyrophosphohydrolase
MSRVSAGLLVYRILAGELQVLLAHPGGPLFRKKDEGVWSIPKGEIESGEDLLSAAQREFAEETGVVAQPPFLPLGSIQQKGGKIVHAWGSAGDFDSAEMHSNTFTLEWPPHSGRRAEFAEIDRWEYFDLETASHKIKATQWELVTRLRQHIGV